MPTTAGQIEIACGDCLTLLRGLAGAAADLVYLDPPFNTRRLQESHGTRFSDSWPTIDAYLAFLAPRLEAAIDTLHASGAILLHCDWRTSHRLRVLLDNLLGEGAFINHLIWQYGLGGSSPRRFARKHDDILFYAKSERYFFSPPRIPATSVRLRGKMKKATDVLSIPSINNMANERTGYPTQKPLALLRLLIEACSPPGGLVIDPFCGSGTTVVAALENGRRAIGIDINPDAVAIARCRITDLHVSRTGKERID